MERITPAEVRRRSLSVREDNAGAADFMLLVAAQMERDARERDILGEQLEVLRVGAKTVGFDDLMAELGLTESDLEGE